MFRPTFCSRPPSTPVALESYLRLHSLAMGEGLLGRVWQTGQPVCLNEFSEAPELAKLRDIPRSAPPP